MLGPLYRLVGRLDLMVEQIKHRTDQVEKSLQNVNLQPKLIYQDEGKVTILQPVFMLELNNYTCYFGKRF